MRAWRRRRIERKLRRFIVEELLDEAYDGRDPLASEAIDSLGREQLVDYIEQEFDITLSEEEIVGEGFRSVPALVGLVVGKCRSVAA